MDPCMAEGFVLGILVGLFLFGCYLARSRE